MPTWAVELGDTTSNGFAPLVFEAEANTREEAVEMIRELMVLGIPGGIGHAMNQEAWEGCVRRVRKPKEWVPPVIFDREVFCRTCDRHIETRVNCKQSCECRDCYYFRGLRDVINRMQAREQAR